MAACAHELYAPAASTDPKVATLGALPSILSFELSARGLPWLRGPK